MLSSPAPHRNNSRFLGIRHDKENTAVQRKTKTKLVSCRLQIPAMRLDERAGRIRSLVLVSEATPPSRCKAVCLQFSHLAMSFSF